MERYYEAIDLLKGMREVRLCASKGEKPPDYGFSLMGLAHHFSFRF